MVAPLLAEFDATVYTQDDPTFPDDIDVDPRRGSVDQLAPRHRDRPDSHPVVDGNEVERTVGWSRTDWQRITGA